MKKLIAIVVLFAVGFVAYGVSEAGRLNRAGCQMTRNGYICQGGESKETPYIDAPILAIYTVKRPRYTYEIIYLVCVDGKKYLMSYSGYPSITQVIGADGLPEICQ